MRMIDAAISELVGAVYAPSAAFLEFLHGSVWSRRMGARDINDFVVGNPHDMPLPEYVDAIRRASVPADATWFGYKLSEPIGRRAAAQGLRDRLGIEFDSEDIFLTKGASNALVVALSTILDPGDEVVFLSPPWFFYESMITFARGIPVRARIDLSTFDVDVDAIAEVLSPRTRAVIINSPNNPTGKIYPPETLTRLGEVLTAASERHGRPIYLISDESYNRIVFDQRTFHSPTAYYANSFLIYSYAKALLTPGQRLGYLALPPSMPHRERMRSAILAIQCSGYGFPDAVLQHALPDLEKLCIDLTQLQRRRDVLIGALRQQGYDVHTPEGAWYLLPRSPLADDATFVDVLAAENVFVLPGRIIELPGYFRVALTASDSMVERSLDGFATAMRVVQARSQTQLPPRLPASPTELPAE